MTYGEADDDVYQHMAEPDDEIARLRSALREIAILAECSKCHGSGRSQSDGPCGRCGGDGYDDSGIIAKDALEATP